MTRFIQDTRYSRAEILDAIGDHTFDGPFVVGAKQVALLVNLGDGPDEPHLELLGARLPPNAPPYPEQEIVGLSNDSTVDECWNALKTFVKRWYEPTNEVKRSVVD